MIMLTVKDLKEDKIKSSRFSDDGYLIKLFSRNGLKARINALLRRHKMVERHCYNYYIKHIDENLQECRIVNILIQLKNLSLLHCLQKI